ncbi:hypothetical protein K458DRAFT_381486 [Lentithecium fluviatile CBS 122367]|uniref:Uncharacterized protein n=1 Tax=Lentithecium fluviatile CBS 122367 TaxID=1168545 RepID=A0A6G1JN38_9PLEO|nr:hypothetical protein K458DRAFT_381486 [Lentithecium fluviatile CBS 122367]
MPSFPTFKSATKASAVNNTKGSTATKATANTKTSTPAKATPTNTRVTTFKWLSSLTPRADSRVAKKAAAEAEAAAAAAAEAQGEMDVFDFLKQERAEDAKEYGVFEFLQEDGKKTDAKGTDGKEANGKEVTGKDVTGKTLPESQLGGEVKAVDKNIDVVLGEEVKLDKAVGFEKE